MSVLNHEDLAFSDRCRVAVAHGPVSDSSLPRRLRLLRGTQPTSSFSARIGFTEKAYRGIEGSRRCAAPFYTIQEIANRTGCDFQWLMTGRGSLLEVVWARRPASKDAPVRLLSKDDRFKRIRSFLHRRGLNMAEVGVIITRRTKRFCSRQHVRMIVTGRRYTPWVQQALARLIGRDGPDLFGDWWWQQRDRAQRRARRG